MLQLQYSRLVHALLLFQVLVLSIGSERGAAAALERAVADALGRAAGAAGAPAGVWGLLADFHSAAGSRVSEREALLKQVTVLASSDGRVTQKKRTEPHQRENISSPS